MHLHIIGSVTMSQIFVRGVRGSTDSLVILGNKYSISIKVILFRERYANEAGIR